MDFLPLVPGHHWYLCSLAPAQIFPSGLWSMVFVNHLYHSYLNSEYLSQTIVLAATPMLGKIWDGFLSPAGLHTGFPCLSYVLLPGHPQSSRATVTYLSLLPRRGYGESACYSFLHLESEHRFPYLSPTPYKSLSPGLSSFCLCPA